MRGQAARVVVGASALAFAVASCGQEFRAQGDQGGAGAGGEPATAGDGPVASAGDTGSGNTSSVGGSGSSSDGGEPAGVAGAGSTTCACGTDQVCEDGQCVDTCSHSETYCDGCVDVSSDPAHCGDCETACEDGMECVEGSCVAPCEDSLRQPIVDIWGQAWDGLERAADTLANAAAACAEGGGRLPRITELHRVSATQSATVGQSNHTNYLWSATPRDGAAQMMLRLSDATISASGITAATKLNYRCTCPTPAPAAFTEGACNGPPEAGCFALGGPQGRYNIDIKDRPALPKSAAIWECQQSKAHLADYLTYVEAIQGQLPNGSGAWLHTGDDAHYINGTVVRFSGNAAWAVAANTSVLAMTAYQPFRCAGVNFEAGTSDVAGDGAHSEGEWGFTADGADHALATYTAAHDVCWDAGGHLGRSVELGHLITSGLPGGSGVATWSSDAAGYGNAQFLTMVVQWTGKLSIFPHANTGLTTGNVTWAYKNHAGLPFRCVYYPIDAAYEGPAAEKCNGGCFELPAAVGAGMLWFDKMDRAAAPLEAAIAGCAAQGGHLASERDYTEAIRQGLPGGTGAWVSTWDIAYGSMNPGLYHTIVKWTAEEPAFADLHPANMTWSPPGTAKPYRCMWTNELR